MAVLNSSAVRAAVNSLSNRDSYTVGHIKKIRWPLKETAKAPNVVERARRILADKHWLYRIDEIDPWFVLEDAFCRKSSSAAAYESWKQAVAAVQSALLSEYESLDTELASLFGVTSNDELRAEFGLSTADILQPTAYSGHRDHSVRAIVITHSDHRDRSSERSDARAIVSSLVLSSQVIWALQGDIRVAAPLANVACRASWRSPDWALGRS
jgi:hypothetical protein